MSERKNIKRNNARIGNDAYVLYGRKGQVNMRLSFPGEPYLQWLVTNGLM
jgi:hypothetical protein